MGDLIINGGCRTMFAGDSLARDVTFTGQGCRLLFTITTEGELVPGPGLSPDAATKAAAAKMVEYFGRAYGSALHAAEERARAAERALRAEQRTVAKQAVEIAKLYEKIEGLKREARAAKRTKKHEEAAEGKADE